MEIHYCDLCNCALDKRHIVVLVEDKNFSDGSRKDVRQEKYFGRENYEICDSCVTLLKKIFTYKKAHVNKVLDWLENLYELPDHTIPEKLETKPEPLEELDDGKEI